MFTLELSFIVLEIPSDAYTTLSRNLNGCSTLSQEYCKLIGWYWKIMRRHLWTLTCPIVSHVKYKITLFLTLLKQILTVGLVSLTTAFQIPLIAVCIFTLGSNVYLYSLGTICDMYGASCSPAWAAMVENPKAAPWNQTRVLLTKGNAYTFKKDDI